jgi:DNA-binding MarR family transcriptional regulator
LSTQQSSALDVWVRFLRAHAAVTRSFNRQLIGDHGLTVNDYEALLVLADADDGSKRRTDLARELELTASGITRLLDGLERAGYVARGECETDARVTYAVLTDIGRKKLREASETHLRSVRALLSERFTPEELEQLSTLLGRLPLAAEAACDV